MSASQSKSSTTKLSPAGVVNWTQSQYDANVSAWGCIPKGLLYRIEGNDCLFVGSGASNVADSEIPTKDYVAAQLPNVSNFVTQSNLAAAINGIVLPEEYDPAHRNVASIAAGIAASQEGDTFTVDQGGACEANYIVVDGSAQIMGRQELRTMNVVETLNNFSANNLGPGAVEIIQDTQITVPCDGLVKYQLWARGIKVTNNAGSGNSRFILRLAILDGTTAITSGRLTYDFPSISQYEVSGETGPLTWQPLAIGNYTLRATLEIPSAADISFEIDQLSISAEQFH